MESGVIRQVIPVDDFPDPVVLVEQAADRAHTPVVGRAQAEFVADVSIPLGVAPRRGRRLAVRLGRIQTTGSVVTRIIALVIVDVRAARVVGVVLDLVDVAHQVTAGIHGLERANAAAQGPRGIRELVLGIRRVVQLHGVRRLRVAERIGAHFGEHAVRLHVLVGLCYQQVPVVVERHEPRNAYTLVNDRVDRPAGGQAVVDHHAVGRHLAVRVRVMDADVRVAAGKGSRDVVDVATARVVVDDRTQCELVSDNWQVEHGLEHVAGVAVRGRRVAGRGVGLHLVEHWLVRDVTHDTGLRAGAEQRALRSLQHFDALEVGGVDVEVTAG